MIAVGRLRFAAVMGVAVAALGGCSGTVQDTLGLGKRQPDEFQVVRRAPLILPPDFNLRPPEPGAVGPVEQDTSASAQQILTGQRPVARETTQSQGELALLDRSQVQAEPGIRQILAQEDPELINLDENRFLFILDFQRRNMQESPNVLDPVAEARRLQAASAGGVITQRTGSTPIPQ